MNHADSQSYDEADVMQALSALGVDKGDTLFVHMALKRLGPFHHTGDNAFAALFRCFQNATGPDGTIAVPTFNFGFCSGQPYDVERTPSEGMGQFAEFVRTLPEARRSPHPFQSIAAAGHQTDYLTNTNSKTAFSAGSSFERLLDVNAKIVFFGIDFVETFVHIAEERANVYYRFWKTFSGAVTRNGVTRQQDIPFFARKLDMSPEPLLDDDFLSRYLRERSIIRSTPLGAGFVSIASAREMVDDLTSKLKSNNRFALK